MLRAELLRPDALSASDLAAWNALCAGSPAFGSPLLRPEFARAVAAVRPDACVAVLKRAGRTVGVFPHHRRPGGLARPIGAPFSDCHGAVTEPADALQPAELLRAIGLRRFRFSSLADPHEAFAASSTAACETFSIDISGSTAEAFLEAGRRANPKRAKNWRRLENRLERVAGPLTLSAPDRCPETFTQLLAWKSAQLVRGGRHDVLRPAWVRTLLSDLFRNPDPAFGGLMITLRAGGVPVAGHFGVRAHGRFHSWVSTYDPELAACAPGFAVMLRAIEAMPALGLHCIDLGAGHEHYKRPFANRVETVFAGEARAGASQSAPWLDRLLASDALRLARRAASRLDHIVAAEPDLPGRARGLWEAALATPRLIKCPPETSAAAA